MKYLHLILTLFAISSCKEQTVQFGRVFSLKIPNTWKYIPQQGIDSFVGIITIDSVDTLFFDYGPYSNNLIHTKIDDMLESGSIITVEDSLITRNHYFTQGNLLDSIYLKPFLTEYYLDTVIQSFPAHVVTPRNSGKGNTGIYVDSIWSKEYHEQIPRLTKKFCLTGYNLSNKNHKAVLKAIKTLKFLNPSLRQD